MLSTAQSDSFRSKFYSIERILRCICICADTKLSVLICPIHNSFKITAYSCFYCLNVTLINLACCSVKRNIITLVEFFSSKCKYFFFFINHNIRAS